MIAWLIIFTTIGFVAGIGMGLLIADWIRKAVIKTINDKMGGKHGTFLMNMINSLLNTAGKGDNDNNSGEKTDNPMKSLFDAFGKMLGIDDGSTSGSASSSDTTSTRDSKLLTTPSDRKINGKRGKRSARSLQALNVPNNTTTDAASCSDLVASVASAVDKKIIITDEEPNTINDNETIDNIDDIDTTNNIDNNKDSIDTTNSIDNKDNDDNEDNKEKSV
jgi:hypothetical protein